MDHREKQSVGPSSTGPDAVFRGVLRHYPLDVAAVRIEHDAAAAGFSGAVIVRVINNAADQDVAVGPEVPLLSADPTRYCLRGWPPSGLSRARLRELHRFLRFVQQQGVPVLPVPNPNIRGETLVTHAGRDWQLEPWMPGVADFCERPTVARLQSAMSTLARFHWTASRYQPTPDGREWFTGGRLAPSPAVEERLALLDRWSDERLKESARRMSREVSKRFGQIAG